MQNQGNLLHPIDNTRERISRYPKRKASRCRHTRPRQRARKGVWDIY